MRRKLRDFYRRYLYDPYGASIALGAGAAPVQSANLRYSDGTLMTYSDSRPMRYV